MIPYIGPAWAAFTVAMADTLIGVIVLLVARRAGPSENEEKLAREIREMAYSEINEDIQQVKGDLDKITAEVRRIRSGVTAFTSGAAGTLGPVISMLLKVLKRD